MGRPLRSDYLKSMNLEVTTTLGVKKLLKQVGYNKYVVVADPKTVVTLVSHSGDVVSGEAKLILKDGSDMKPVLKITKRVFTTADETYAYEVTESGLHFFKDGVSIPALNVPSVDNEPTDEPASNDEPVDEPTDGE